MVIAAETHDVQGPWTRDYRALSPNEHLHHIAKKAQEERKD